MKLSRESHQIFLKRNLITHTIYAVTTFRVEIIPVTVNYCIVCNDSHLRKEKSYDVNKDGKAANIFSQKTFFS